MSCHKLLKGKISKVIKVECRFPEWELSSRLSLSLVPAPEERGLGPTCISLITSDSLMDRAQASTKGKADELLCCFKN